MARPFSELLHDVESFPGHWEVVKSESAPSKNRRNRDGTSVQERLRHKVSGEEIVRHLLLRADGRPFAEAHFRPIWKGSS